MKKVIYPLEIESKDDGDVILYQIDADEDCTSSILLSRIQLQLVIELLQEVLSCSEEA